MGYALRVAGNKGIAYDIAKWKAQEDQMGCGNESIHTI